MPNPLFELDYAYYPTGNVQSILDVHARRQQTFGYDKLSRLTSVTAAGGYASASWTYDAHGNGRAA